MTAIASAMALMLMTLTAGSSVAAQNSTPASGAGTDCVTALGNGNDGDACINIVHASPDAPLVDIYLDDELALSGLGFGWYSNWIPVPAGEHRVQVTANGASPDDAVIDASVDVDGGVGYHIAATGFLAEIEPQIFVADLGELTDDNARVRVVHTVPDAPAVDIAVTGGDVLVSDLSFPDASEYLEIPAGTYDLDVRIAGTQDVALPLPGVAFETDTVYEVFAIGTAADSALAALVVPSAITSSGATSANCAGTLGIGGEGDACVNVVHASPDAPAVDVFVNGEVAVSGLAFGAFSGWVALPAGEYQVQVAPAGSDASSAMIDATLPLEAGIAYHVAATGTVAEIALEAYPADFSQVATENARVRVIHTSPDAPAVDIAVADGDVLISDLEFPLASDAIEVPAGTYDLEVRVAGTSEVALPLPDVTVEAGMTYDVFAVGLVEDGSLNVVLVPSMTAHGE